jgi:hypothetical protein
MAVMRSALLLLTTLLLALPAAAGPYAPQEFDFSEIRDLEASAFGIVESVRDLSARKAREIVVRLEDGRQVVVVQGGMQPIEPGEQVRLARHGHNFFILNL